MINGEVFLLLGAGALLVLLGVLVGGWLMFKGKAAQGEGFLRTPKGEVFSIPDTDGPEFPSGPGKEEQNVMKRTEKFLEMLGGKMQ